jgi:Rrf2 family transcriptional regulator, iron-sulfur cluster assembly transcription factor
LKIVKFSKFQEYGLRSMILLAVRSKLETPQARMQAKEISQVEEISPKYLEQILMKLTKAGLLSSKVGAGGGYFLSRPANQISLGQIIRALDGRLEPVACSEKPPGNNAPVR